MYLIYTFLLSVGLILTLPYYLIRFRRYRATFADRLGLLKIPQLKHTIWVHAVSVGEVKAVEKLLERLRQQFPDKPLVVSTATPAGQQLARERRDIVDHTLYFPIDLPWCVRRVVDRLSPEMVIIAETEIWPNFLRACRARGARVVMINGRISDRSFGRYRLVRGWLRRVFEHYAVLGMQSETDRQRIEAIGADPRKVAVFGNLKYDATGAVRRVDPELGGFLEDCKPLWIAASTMPGEEELVLNAFKQVLNSRPDLKLLVAPRHPERCDAVTETINSRGFDIVRRSQLQTAQRRAPVLLLDTIGELAGIFEYADVVYMGGTLVRAGGHNILEPARHAKPIVFGPHMENFRDIARVFLDGEAAIRIEHASELAEAVAGILSDPQRSAALGRNALAIIRQNTGATERVLRMLEPAGARR